MRKSLFLILSLPSILSGCNPAVNLTQKIDPQKTYQGYPCFEACADFQTGYEQAISQKFSLKSSCQALPINQQLGCQAYVNDLEIDTIDNGGLKLEWIDQFIPLSYNTLGFVLSVN